jgi:hypothetical protein
MGIMGDFDRCSWVLLLTSSAIAAIALLLGAPFWVAVVVILVAFTIDLIRDTRQHPFQPEDFLSHDTRPARRLARRLADRTARRRGSA